MAIEILKQLNIGIFYNIFICLILSVVSFTLVRQIKLYFSFTKHTKPIFYYKNLRLFWLYNGFFWLFSGIRLIFNIRGDSDLEKISLYLLLILLSVQVLFIFMYIFSIIFHKYNFSSGISLFSALLPGIFLVVSFLEGVKVGEHNIWNIEWSLTPLGKSIFIYGIFLVIIILLAFIIIRELIYFIFKNLTRFELKHIFTSLILGLYFTIFYFDFLYIVKDWYLLLLRTILLVPMFLVFYVYSQKFVQVRDSYLESLNFIQKVLQRRPLLLKSILLMIFVTIVPLILASIIIYYSFDFVLHYFNVPDYSILMEYIQKQIIIITLIIGILTFFIGIGWVRNILIRVKLLFKGTQEIAKGNFDYYIDELGSKDEIRLLAHLFNKISDYLKLYRQKVIETSETLEQRVIERTKQLEEKTNEINALAEEHKKILNQLKARSDIIIDNMGDGVIILDKDFNIIKVNKFVLEKFKKADIDLLNKNIFDFKILSSNEEFLQALKIISSGEKDVYEIKLSFTEPFIGDLEIKFSKFYDKTGNIGYMIFMHEPVAPWGVVLDSETLQPVKLAVVRLIDEKTNYIIDTEVTDPYGRFGFFLSKGRYFLSVEKQGYHFPSVKEQGYHGEVIEIKDETEGTVNFKIFLDPVKQNINNLGFNISENQESQQNISGDNNLKLKTVEELSE